MRVLFFDTETSDLINFKARDTDPSQPWVCQLAMILDTPDAPPQQVSLIVQSDGLPMSKGAQDVHGISVEIANYCGIESGAALGLFINFALRADLLVAHNYTFDIRLLNIMAKRICNEAAEDMTRVKAMSKLCTMQATTKLCQLPYPSGKAGFKWPKLEELHQFLFNEEMENAHDAMADVLATRRCYYELVKRGVV